MVIFTPEAAPLTGFCSSADAFNKWRYALVLLWKFAVSRKLAATCEPEKIESRSTSKKLEATRNSASSSTCKDSARFMSARQRGYSWQWSSRW